MAGCLLPSVWPCPGSREKQWNSGVACPQGCVPARLVFCYLVISWTRRLADYATLPIAVVATVSSSPTRPPWQARSPLFTSALSNILSICSRLALSSPTARLPRSISGLCARDRGRGLAASGLLHASASAERFGPRDAQRRRALLRHRPHRRRAGRDCRAGEGRDNPSHRSRGKQSRDRRQLAGPEARAVTVTFVLSPADRLHLRNYRSLLPLAFSCCSIACPLCETPRLDSRGRERALAVGCPWSLRNSSYFAWRN